MIEKRDEVLDALEDFEILRRKMLSEVKESANEIQHLFKVKKELTEKRRGANINAENRIKLWSVKIHD